MEVVHAVSALVSLGIQREEDPAGYSHQEHATLDCAVPFKAYTIARDDKQSPQFVSCAAHCSIVEGKHGGVIGDTHIPEHVVFRGASAEGVENAQYDADGLEHQPHPCLDEHELQLDQREHGTSGDKQFPAP